MFHEVQVPVLRIRQWRSTFECRHEDGIVAIQHYFIAM